MTFHYENLHRNLHPYYPFEIFYFANGDLYYCILQNVSPMYLKRINAIYHLDAVDYLLILMHELPRKEIAKSGTIGLASEPAAC